MRSAARAALLLGLIGLLAGVLLGAMVWEAWAEEGTEPRKLEEVDALRMQLLVAERRVLEERAGRLQAELRLAEAEYRATAQALDAAIEAAAKKAGVDLSVYSPDLIGRRWRPR